MEEVVEAAESDQRQSNRWLIAYESLMGVLALITVGTLFSDAEWATVTNAVIYGVFVVDVGVRFIRSDDRRHFPRRNWPDLVALVPFELFRAFRTIRLLRLVRLFRAIRLANRVGPTVRGVLRQNGLQYLLMGVAGLICVGGVLAWLLEDSITTLGDGVWWAFVTTTTVGYGDLSPTNLPGRVVAVVLMLSGIVTLGMITGAIATYFVEASRDGSDLPLDVHYVRGRLDAWNELTTAERRRLVRLLRDVAEDTAADPSAAR
jgi:voltage-gated potassium channel